MNAPNLDPLSALLELVRQAARQGVADALSTTSGGAHSPTSPLVDKRGLAHALGVSTASVDRLCRSGRIPFVTVGEVKRFDLEAVRTVLTAPSPDTASPLEITPSAAAPSTPSGFRLLSRGSR
jgi:hypothetical protein